MLRDHVDLPQNARGYCDDWRSAGFLVRRPAAETRGETLELSPDAVVALRVLAQLEAPRSTITRVQEPAPTRAELPTLTALEHRALHRLRAEGDVRLEQERIPWSIALAGLEDADH